MNDLDKVTARFGRAYERNKKAKLWLEKQQKRLFGEFTRELDNRHIGRQHTVHVSGENPDLYVKRYYPGWRIVGNVTGTGYVVIEEDPALTAYTYVNQETGMVFGRTTVTGTPSLDDERLRAENPELWERITQWPRLEWDLVRYTVCRFISHGIKWSDDSIDATTDVTLRERNVGRVLMDPSEMDVDDLVLMQEYILPGAVSVRLVPPRPVKEEEIT